MRVLVDRELYVPRSWIGNQARCGEAGIGDSVSFATRLELAKTMIGRVRELGLPFAWLTADEVYGGNGKLRKWLEENKKRPGRSACTHRSPERPGGAEYAEDRRSVFPRMFPTQLAPGHCLLRRVVVGLCAGPDRPAGPALSGSLLPRAARQKRVSVREASGRRE